MERRYRNKYGGGLIDFAKKGLICKKLKTFETVNNDWICSELTVSDKTWVCLSVHRPPSRENLELFFEELTSCLIKAGETYENFIVIGDFNIDIKTKGREYEKFEDFCSLFNHSNLIKTETLFSKNHKSTIDLFTTNKPNIFQHMNITETGLSDFHKMIAPLKVKTLRGNHAPFVDKQLRKEIY